MGHTEMHLPQRMQAGCSTVRSSFSQKARMALVPLPMGGGHVELGVAHHGAAHEDFEGALSSPRRRRPGRSLMGVPDGAEEVLGAPLTPEPETVTTRWVTGLPW